MPAKLPRRQVLLLSALVVTLAAALIYQFSGRSNGPTGGPRGGRGAAPAGASSPAGLQAVPEVRLEDLKAPRPEPVSAGRNLFRDRPAPPPPPPAASAAVPARPDPNAPPPPPPPPPPIPLKFIGVVQAKEGTLAVFSDGRDVFYGREGDVIEGRYKIIRIGVESVEVSYVDGRGRQRIPLTG